MTVHDNWVTGEQKYLKWGTETKQNLGSTPEEVAQHIVDNSDNFSEKAVEKAQAILDL
tara:strand:- start:1191 stop:1364 length:174 start_codon:yes stop_codon:yes gene_type:complete